MSCKHTEDVCQHCLEKVQTEVEPPPTASEKRFSILMDSSFLLAVGAMAYFNGKLFYKASVYFLDSILGTIGAPTRKE